MASTKTPPTKKTPEPRKAEPRKPAATRTPTEQRIQIGSSGMADWTSLEAIPISPEQRQHMIRDAAYFRAERRGFAHGDPVQDWVEAEADVDRMFQGVQGSVTGC